MKLIIYITIYFINVFITECFISMGIYPSFKDRSFEYSSSSQSISSWGLELPSSPCQEEESDPEKNIHCYLNSPESVKIRDNLDGTVLVSGFMKYNNSKDKNIFQFLSSEPIFRFDKIVAFVDNIQFAKKRLTSRTARYTGLLNKLDFSQAEYPGALPNLSQLDNIKSWVANVENDLMSVENVARLVEKSPSVKNVSILITNSYNFDISNVRDILRNLQMNGKAFSIVAVGYISENPEGSSPYQISEFGNNESILTSNTSFSRDESLRIVTACLGLQSSVNKAMVFSEIHGMNMTETKLIRGLREGGYNRIQEIDHMITKGSDAYKRAISEYKVRVPKQTTEDEWIFLKEEEFKKSALEREEKAKTDYQNLRKTVVEEIAGEWAKREYYRMSLKGDMLLSEEDYVKSIWERALFEGDIKFRMLRKNNKNVQKQSSNEKQARKKATLLARSKAKYLDILDARDIN